MSSFVSFMTLPRSHTHIYVCGNDKRSSKRNLPSLAISPARLERWVSAITTSPFYLFYWFCCLESTMYCRNLKNTRRTLSIWTTHLSLHLSWPMKFGTRPSWNRCQNRFMAKRCCFTLMTMSCMGSVLGWHHLKCQNSRNLQLILPYTRRKLANYSPRTPLNSWD